jgi:hypothetical protein
MSSIWGFNPRFSWTTRTAGSFPAAFVGCTRYPRIVPLPFGEAYSTY